MNALQPLVTSLWPNLGLYNTWPWSRTLWLKHIRKF